ncbi:hypothetical protein BEL04_08540 [Mucilaginibacter sp. PPCGB 2223]|uniref:hypothetical protein n=1 Tax=Mucilaginibacter sp. PPCGB 2223 TaxID=1886027 RepID=UPI0008260751|nr:hypothetical protein [Mucilaginibacter sp. PPCGB 2223]OCX54296.1 hypothetical protein BEL04_08540 [Mucilaginibacter sp. PPCGB 2223]
MKKKLIYVGLFLSMILSCKKDEVAPSSPAPTFPASDTLSIAAAKSYVSSLSTAQTSGSAHRFSLSRLTIPWEKAEHMPNKKSGYWLISLEGRPIMNNIAQGYRKLAFLRDSTGRIQARILEIIPDGIWYQRKQKVTTADFTGRIFFYDEAYHLLNGIVYSSGKQIGEIKPGKSETSPTNTHLHASMLDIVEDCQWYEENYYDADGVLTVYAERDCSYSIYDSSLYSGIDMGGGDYAGGGGGGGGDASGAPEVSNLPGESGPKLDPKAYMNCFGSIPDANATMQVTVYVQEPFPGTTFNLGPNSVGHTAIGLTKTGGGTSITQVVGFYPDATGKDKLHAPSKLVDNSGLDYNVSITYNVSATDFNKIVNYVSSPPGTYDLTDFNCTSFVFYACAAGDVDLPSPYTSVMTGQYRAMTPAGLGDSISNLKGQSNVNTNGGLAKASNGPCN